MAAAAGTALLRSVGRNMVRHPGAGPRSSCRPLSSSSSGSTPSPTDIKDRIETIELDRAMARLKRVSIYSACFLVLGGSIFFGLVKPKVEEIKEQRSSKMKAEIIQALKKKYESVQVIEGENALAALCKAIEASAISFMPPLFSF